jgi:hypothetical protein
MTYCNGFITTKKRQDDYIAFITDNPKIWECAKRKDEAIGSLIMKISSDIVITGKY